MYGLLQLPGFGRDLKGQEWNSTTVDEIGVSHALTAVIPEGGLNALAINQALYFLDAGNQEGFEHIISAFKNQDEATPINALRAIQEQTRQGNRKELNWAQQLSDTVINLQRLSMSERHQQRARDIYHNTIAPKISQWTDDQSLTAGSRKLWSRYGRILGSIGAPPTPAVTAPAT